MVNLIFCSVVLKDISRMNETFTCTFSDLWMPCLTFISGLYCIRAVWELSEELQQETTTATGVGPTQIEVTKLYMYTVHFEVFSSN
jgi:hypothetical protein